MPRMLGYQPRPLKSTPSEESRRKAKRYFTSAAIVGGIGMVFFVFSMLISCRVMRDPINLRDRRGRSVTAELCCVAGTLCIAGALPTLNAAFYHQSGFEDRHRK